MQQFNQLYNKKFYSQQYLHSRSLKGSPAIPSVLRQSISFQISFHFLPILSNQKAMNKAKIQISHQELEFMKERQYRILKSMMYKFQLPIKSVSQKPRQDNFIAYSITKKVSQSGWFSNQRLLAIDCANNQLFYLTKVPSFVLEESNPLQIQQLRESPYVKHRLSLNSFSKDIKSIERQDKTLIIQLSEAFAHAGIPDSQGKIFWKFQMTSTQLAKDWVNIITLLQQGKLTNPGQVKKTALTPEKHLQMKKYGKDQPSTPQSISSVNSLHMKSENLNADLSQTYKHRKGQQLTPNYKRKGQSGGDDQKYFKKAQSTEGKGQKGNLEDLVEEQNNAISQFEDFDRAENIKKFKNWKIDEQDAKYSQILEEFESKDPKIPGGIQTDKDTRYTPLSQQKQTPQSTFMNESMRKMKQMERNSIGSRLYKKYQVNTSDVIQEEGEQVQIKSMLTEQFNLRNTQGDQAEFNVYEDLQAASNKEEESPVKLRKQIRKNTRFASTSDKQTNASSEVLQKSPHKSSSGFEKSFSIKCPFVKPLSPYKNTYDPVQSLPELSSTYNWNEVYFRILIEYYDCITSYNLKCIRPESKNQSSSKHSFIEQKFFDILLKLEKHIEKFQLYCSKGAQSFVQNYILCKNHRGYDHSKASESLIKIIREEIAYLQQSNGQNGSELKQQNTNFGEVNQADQSLLGKKKSPSEKTDFKLKPSKKLIEFHYEGIYFFVTLNPAERIHSSEDKTSDNFWIRQNSLKKLNADLILINHLHPFFTQTDRLLNRNFFHVFTPMLSMIEYAGLKFYCKAVFNTSDSAKYIKVLLDPESIEKSLQKHINMNRYIKQRLGQTSLSSLVEEDLVQKIGALYLTKQFGKHTFMVVDTLELDEQDIRPSFSKSHQLSPHNAHRKLPPMMNELQKAYRKELFLLEKLQNNFTHEGAIPLTTHQSFNQLLLLSSPYQYIHTMSSLLRLYDLLKNQFRERHQFLQFSSSYRFLKNPLFLSYLTNLLQNEIVILCLLSQINLKSRRFLSKIYFKAQQLKKMVDIPTINTLKPLYHNIVDGIESLELTFEEFSWNKNKPDTVFYLHQNQSFEAPELNEMIMSEIISKAMNELFVIEKEEKRTEGSIEGKIKLKEGTWKWLNEQMMDCLGKKEMSSLDTNYIYEGLMQELGIERYFDPINFEGDTLESMMKIARSKKEEVGKLIRDPFYSRSGSKSSMLRVRSKSYLSSGEITQVARHGYEVEYVAKLMEQEDKGNKLWFPIKVVRSVKFSCPTAEYVDPPKMKWDLVRINELILQKEFNEAIEIYYMLINSNKKSSSVYYQYFKQVRGNISRQKKNYSKSNATNFNFNFDNQHQSISKTHLYHTPALMTYVLATQCVAFSFLKLLYGRKNKIQNGQIPEKSVFKSSTSLQKTQKNQYLSLTLKYNVMSHFGTEIIYGYEHVIYMVNQLIFGFVRLKNQEILEAGQHFQQAQRAMEDANDIFLHKQISLPVLYIKALMDLQCRNYMAAIQSIRMLMQAIDSQWNKIKDQEGNSFHNKTYWVEKQLTEMFEAEIQDLSHSTMNDKLHSYTYLAYEILILCNENDPRSNMDSNRQIIKGDIIDFLKQFPDFTDYTLKMLQLLWNLETKIMTFSKRTQVRRALMKLYNHLINLGSKEKLIRQMNLEEVLNPLKKSQSSTTFIFSYLLFNRILAKSQKYWNFLVLEFNSVEFRELNEFVSERMWEREQGVLKSNKSEHYDIKKELFKQIILLVKFMLMLGENFIYQSLGNKKHQSKDWRKKDSDEQ